MPLLALNRKKKAGESGGMGGWLPPIWPASPANAGSMAVSWPDTCSLLTQSCLHRFIVRAATPLGRNPCNVAVGVLDVTGFAMDAILGVDLEAGT